MWSTNDRVRPEPSLYLKAFGSAHIYQSEIPISIHHEIFGFKVAVYDTVCVEVFHHEEDLAYEKAGMLYREGDDFGDDVEEVFSFNKVHDEIDEVGVFKEFVEADDEWIARYSSKYFFLVHDVLDDLGFFDVVAVQHFDSIQFGSLGIVADVDLSEVTLPQLTYYLEVTNLHFFLEHGLFLVDTWLFLDFDGDRAGTCLVKLTFDFAEFPLVLGDHVLPNLDGLSAGDLIQFNHRVWVESKILALESGIQKHKDTVLVLGVFLKDDLPFFKVNKLSIIQALSQFLKGNYVFEVRL